MTKYRVVKQSRPLFAPEEEVFAVQRLEDDKIWRQAGRILFRTIEPAIEAARSCYRSNLVVAEEVLWESDGDFSLLHPEATNEPGV